MILTKDTDALSEKIIEIKSRNKSLLQLKEALQKVFPDHWEVTPFISPEYAVKNFIYYKNTYNRNSTDMRWCLSFNVYIHIPELYIKNGRHQSHKITDLYLRLGCSLDIMTNRIAVDEDLYGIRTSMTLEELAVGYAHSHLPTIGEDLYFNDFCLGRGALRYMLTTGTTHFKTSLEWQYLFNVVKEFVSWESISGVPYINMDTIGTLNPVEVDSNTANSVIQNIKIPELDFKITDTSIVVLPNKALEDTIYEYLKTYNIRSLMCYKTINGDYVTHERNSIENEYTGIELEFFEFKGEPVEFKIINDNNIEKYEYNATNPNLTKKICDILSKRLTKKAITYNKTNKEHTGKNTKESISSDTLPV